MSDAVGWPTRTMTDGATIVKSELFAQLQLSGAQALDTSATG
jgi:hypothetical protein